MRSTRCQVQSAILAVLFVAFGLGCSDQPDEDRSTQACVGCDVGDGAGDVGGDAASVVDDAAPAPCEASGDEDGDGVCAGLDCDDSDANNTGEDGDADGVCTPDDCADDDPAVFPGAGCDDGDPNTDGDVFNESCICAGGASDSFTDSRDGQTYATVQIGEQRWMAENLRYATGGDWCYEDIEANCDVYGRLYDATAALDACPAGWGLPAESAWHGLVLELGGDDVAGGPMKATGTVEGGDGLWNAPNLDATNASGFNAIPGGYRLSGGSYSSLGDDGFWWTSTEIEPGFFFYANVNYDYGGVVRQEWINGNNGFSIRCVADVP